MAKAGATSICLLVLFVLLFVQLCASATSVLNRKGAPRSRGASDGNDRYVVVFDAGKISTEVHVFRFDENANLLKINGSLQVYNMSMVVCVEFDDDVGAQMANTSKIAAVLLGEVVPKEPVLVPKIPVEQPLTSYAENPAGVVSVMATLLEMALDAVPADHQPEAPVLFGAFDELFLLGEEKYGPILEVIRDVLSKSPLLYEPEWVSIIPATKQAAYVWDTVNYLRGNMDGDYSKTVAVLTQESASAEIAYAISSEAAANAPRFPGGEEYITRHHIQSNDYHLYSHGYFPYGAYGVRTAILKYTNDSYTYCVTPEYDEQWDYYGETFNVRASPTGSNYEKCRANVLLALNLNATCHVKNCTFDGAWSGGGGAGLEKIYLTNGFHNTGADVGVVNRSNPSTDLRLSAYEKAAKVACAVKSFDEAHKLYPDVPPFDLPYVCMDLVYVYAVLADGFGIDPSKVVTAVNSVPYGGSSMSVQWCLGAALELLSSKQILDRTNAVSHSPTLVHVV